MGCRAGPATPSLPLGCVLQQVGAGCPGGSAGGACGVEGRARGCRCPPSHYCIPARCLAVCIPHFAARAPDYNGQALHLPVLCSKAVGSTAVFPCMSPLPTSALLCNTTPSPLHTSVCCAARLRHVQVPPPHPHAAPGHQLPLRQHGPAGQPQRPWWVAALRWHCVPVRSVSTCRRVQAFAGRAEP